MKKVEPSNDQMLEAATEESSTSLAPSMLFLTTADAATPTTEESRILPVTSLQPQVN
ncbi:Draxin [Cricetulus griseus]|uniref:Draxin n=1 Tax=Cricetulus griseus TaxID=10029 RepID=G3IN10_CRIGR|nr:Draxin [Cricetulus griseus]